MPRPEVGTPKWISNKMKAKGLQKLRWYCQMCQKQCRDENGFKCHTSSESHQRQLLLFAENPRKYLDEFSREFAHDFMQLLRHRFGTKRVHANQVYQEYIADRNHLHMNATRWETLTGFVMWLGRTGKCKVDQTEKGWFIAYIDRDPDTIKKQEDQAKKVKMDKDDEERLQDFISKQVERAKDKVKEDEDPIYTELQRTEEDKIVLTVSLKAKENEKILPASTPVLLTLPKKENKVKKEDRGEKRKKNALDEIMEEQEKIKEKKNRKQYWLHEGIVVKVITQSLGEKYFKKKGIILEVQGNFQAIVKMLDSSDKLKLDQAHLETVIPALGKQVKVVNGAYRGFTATLLELHAVKFSCTIKIDSGPLNGREIPDVKYEDICKVHIQN